jgi:hypothetical protein
MLRRTPVNKMFEITVQSRYVSSKEEPTRKSFFLEAISRHEALEIAQESYSDLDKDEEGNVVLTEIVDISEYSDRINVARKLRGFASSLNRSLL